MPSPDPPGRDEASASSFPDVARAGTRAGIASAFAYFKLRARLFAGETHSQLILGGHYTLTEKLGEGATGVVFLAVDTLLMRKVAVKVLRSSGDPLARARLLREAQHLALLNHPNVLQVHEVGEHLGEIYIVMEYVEGAPLDVWLAKNRPSFRELLALLLDVGRGLAAAHAVGVIHRDVKPANILIGKDGRARIGDFGLAWLDGSLEAETSETARPGARTQVSTQSQNGAGTPAYMSPEQIRRDELDARSDLFSFCVVVWEAVFKSRPHAASSIEALHEEILGGQVVAPATRPSGVPARLEAILRRGLAPSRKARYADMRALLAALEGLQQPRGAYRVALAAAFGAGVVLAGSQVMTGTCTGTDALGPLWSSTAATELRGSLRSAGHATADALVDQLDVFAGDLQEGYKKLCELQRDANMRAEYHRRALLCLDERREFFGEVLSTLRSADGPVLALVPEDLTDALGSSTRCLQPKYFTADVEPPTPEQEDALSGVRRLRRDGEVALLRGAYSAAAQRFADAVEQAREVDHKPETAKALYDLGRTHLRLRRGREAFAALREAQIEADHAGDSFAAADASLLLQNTAVAIHDLEAAEWYEGDTLARLHRNGEDHGGKLGELELARVDRLLRLDRPDKAEERLAEAEKHLLEDPLEHGLWRFNLPRMKARVAAARGRFQEGADHAANARAEIAATDNNEQALYVEELGNYLHNTGEFEEAERELSRARDLYYRAFGPDSLQALSVEVALVRLYDEQGRRDEVARIAARVDPFLQRHPDEPMTLDDRVAFAGYLGRLGVDAGNWAAAVEAFDRGYAALAAVDVPVHDVNFALMAASGADLRVNVPELRDVPRARAQIAAALERWTSDRWHRDPGYAVLLLRVAADVALAAGDVEGARRHAEAGLQWLPRAPSVGAEARLKYALARAKGRDAPGARELASSARDIFLSLGSTGNAAEIQRWLAGRP